MCSFSSELKIITSSSLFKNSGLNVLFKAFCMVDLIISALNKALSKSKSDSQEKMNSIAGGMMGGMKIPGL